jgi:hypothetical protein
VLETAHPRRTRALLWVGLSAWSGLLAADHRRQLTQAWGFTQTGTRALAAGGSAGGLHLYSQHPELQIGPLTFVAGLPLLLLPGRARSPVLWAVLTLGGLVVLALAVQLGRSARGGSPARRTVLVGGVLVLWAWSVLAIPGGHLDDALALGFGVLAVRARIDHRLILTALAVAAAADAKPWAFGFAALLIDPGTGRRRQLRAALVLVAGVVVVWAPFLIGDTDLSALFRFTIPDAADSALRALGWTGARTPGWDRPVEVAGGLFVGAVATLRGRPGAVLLAVVAVRLLVDPGTHTYYTAGLLLAAFVFDLTCTRRVLPVATMLGFVGIFVPHLVLAGAADAGVRGVARLVTCVVLILLTAAPARVLG